MSHPWLTSARASDPELIVPGSPAQHGAEFRLSDSSVSVSAHGAEARLDWHNQRSTFATLVQVLAARPDLRSRLSDTARTELLAKQLGARALGMPATHTGTRRATIFDVEPWPVGALTADG